MKILMPFWTLGKWMDIYTKLNWHGTSFHIVHFEGSPKQKWKKYFSFQKIALPYSVLKSKMTRFYLSRRKLYNQVKDLDVDIIFTLSNILRQEFSRYCSKKMGVPYVVRLRGSDRDVREACEVNAIKKGVLNFLDTKNLQQASLIIPLSRHLAKKANEWGVKKEKITQPVYAGVDTSIFRKRKVERSKKFTVAYAGRISPEKRVLCLLKISKKLPNVKFIIAGEKQMAVNFPSNIEYFGRLPFSEMPKFYNKADLVTLPSITEGFGMCLLEAYACEKPVLVAKEAFPEELKVFGSVGDMNKFESEIKILMKTDLETLGRQARSYVKKHYNWDEFAYSIVKYLNNVVDKCAH